MTAAFPAGLPGLGRRTLWRGVLTVTGGVRVIGDLPDGPCVIVANHSSHADTAALLATIPGRRAPGCRGRRRLLVRRSPSADSSAAGWPVRSRCAATVVAAPTWPKPPECWPMVAT